jgi:uncharacterized protein YbjT (DUF2867 family)
MSKTAWVAGASGLIGQHLIAQLIADEDYKRIVALVRTPLTHASFQNAKVEQFKVNFDQLHAPCSQVDSLFCALGSTSRKTPNHDDYYRIDVTYPLAFARLGLENGARFYGLVSAHGANARAFSSYLKMKGTLEQQLTTLGYPRLAIARPSLLKGDRQEFRLLEKASEGFMSLLPGNYRAIHASKVAQSLIQADKRMPEGKHILPSSNMQSPADIHF